MEIMTNIGEILSLEEAEVGVGGSWVVGVVNVTAAVYFSAM